MYLFNTYIHLLCYSHIDKQYKP